MVTKNISVDVEIDLDDFDEEELIEAMDNLGYNCVKRKLTTVRLQDLYELKRTGKTAEFDTAFASYCWQEIGRII